MGEIYPVTLELLKDTVAKIKDGYEEYLKEAVGNTDAAFLEMDAIIGNVGETIAELDKMASIIEGEENVNN